MVGGLRSSGACFLVCLSTSCPSYACYSKIRMDPEGLPFEGGALEKKLHLVKWPIVYSDKRKGAWESDVFPSSIEHSLASGYGTLLMKGTLFVQKLLVGSLGCTEGLYL